LLGRKGLSLSELSTRDGGGTLMPKLGWKKKVQLEIWHGVPMPRGMCVL